MKALEESKHERQVTRMTKPQGSFEQFIQMYKNMGKGKGLLKGHVPASMYWLVQDTKFLGWVSIRHKLTPTLKLFGGHIGYWIRPKYRGKGLGKLILRLSLQKARLIGIKKVLLTCGARNMASKNIIEHNGGKFQDTVSSTFGKKVMRFWISFPLK